VSDDPTRRYAHYATGNLERLLRGLEQLYGDELPAFIDEIRAELARRRDESAREPPPR
jgi:hypothetical protein